MRKELIVFVNTMEKGEEFSVSSVSSNRKFVILTSPTGLKFTASSSELLEALAELNAFNQGQSLVNYVDESVPVDFNVEFGGNE